MTPLGRSRIAREIGMFLGSLPRPWASLPSPPLIFIPRTCCFSPITSHRWLIHYFEYPYCSREHHDIGANFTRFAFCKDIGTLRAAGERLLGLKPYIKKRS